MRPVVVHRVQLEHACWWIPSPRRQRNVGVEALLERLDVLIGHTDRAAEVGPALVPPARVVVRLRVEIFYSVEEGKEETVRNLESRISTCRLTCRSTSDSPNSEQDRGSDSLSPRPLSPCLLAVECRQAVRPGSGGSLTAVRSAYCEGVSEAPKLGKVTCAVGVHTCQSDRRQVRMQSTTIRKRAFAEHPSSKSRHTCPRPRTFGGMHNNALAYSPSDTSLEVIGLDGAREVIARLCPLAFPHVHTGAR